MLQSSSNLPGNHGVPLKLLLVDDDDVDRERVRRFLGETHSDAVITEASSAEEVTNILRNDQFDCMILDYHLGNCISTDLLPEISTLTKPSFPIIMVTGQGDERVAVNAMHKGVYDYIPKSQLRASLLGSVVNNSLRRAGLEQELRSQQERLEQLSLYDALTGLPNRSLFFDRLEQALLGARRSTGKLAVMQLDLDLFKEVNDHYGHAAGDAVLRVVSQRMQTVLRASDTVARLGGDAFAAVLTSVESPEAAILTAQKIIAAVSEPIFVSDRPLQVGVAVGIALYPTHGDGVDALLAKADRAMYCAKRARGYEVYVETMEAAKKPVLLSHQLRQAIEDEEIHVEYQPIVNLASRSVIGAEALARWHSPTLGVVEPVTFIPVAERCALIAPLTYAVIDMALNQAQQWQMAGFEIPVSINLSACLLDDVHLTDRVLQALQFRKLAPSILTLELTETALMSNVEQGQRILGNLRAAGIRISIDDFGAGFTSFKYLRDLDISEIKIDGLYTGDTQEGGRDNVIVQSIAMLARGFGIPVTAEGIENIHACDALNALGCDQGQGYAIGRPMSGTEFLNWKMRWEAGVSSLTLQ